MQYMTGFGNHFESEAEPNALVKGRNSPQKVPFGLYAEQLSGSAFTAPRSENMRSWLYRICPSVIHNEFVLMEQNAISGASEDPSFTPPNQMRWNPKPYPQEKTHFVAGIETFAAHAGAAIHLYAANASMHKEFFYDADGELLIVPQEGALHIKTEFGFLDVKPGEICVIPRGVKFQVQLLNEQARGYICENFGAIFRLPDLGVIGSNGLANPRDFLYPHAAYEELTGDFSLLAKFQGRLWQTRIHHSPLDVVAWHGNYAPYKYNLSLFNALNTVSYDHADPSIFTVLTSASSRPGVANVDFVIFPPRWMVASDTFRPPYFHRNVMSEFMGLIHGQYDAKGEGFAPGGCSLHNCMSAHGPDAQSYQQAVAAELKPEYYSNTLAFMFEGSHCWNLTKNAYNATFRQENYLHCWQDLKPHFKLRTPA